MEFSSLGLGLAALVALYVLAVEPWWGKRAYAALERRRESDPRALVRFYGQGMAVWWPLAGIALLSVLISPGVAPADLGLGLAGTSWGTLAGMLVGAAAAGAVLYKFTPNSLAPGQAVVSAMLPRTPRERWAAVGLSVTAGVCEEIVFRGLFIAVGVSLGLELWAAAAVSLAVFSFAHLYQGLRGMLLVTLVGLALTSLYLSTGSLLVPIVMHILIDLRALLITPRPEAAREPGQEEREVVGAGAR